MEYLILIEPFDTGWKIIRTSIEDYKHYVKDSYNDFVREAKSKANSARWQVDLAFSWIMILTIFLLKDSVLFWLLQMPCAIGSYFIRFTAHVVYMEAFLWRQVDIFAPA